MMDIVSYDKSLFTTYQPDRDATDQGLTRYLQDFKAKCDVINASGGVAGLSKAACEVVAAEQGLLYDENTHIDKRLEIEKEAIQQYLAALFFSGLNGKRYAALKASVHNQWLVGTDAVPKSYDQVMKLALGYKAPPGMSRPTGSGGQAGLAFTQVPKSQPDKPEGSAGGTKTNKYGETDCHHCGSKQHWLDDCPKLDTSQKKELKKQIMASREGAQLLNVAEEEEEMLSFFMKKESSSPIVQRARRTLNEDHVYLDSCSTFNQVFTDKHIEDIEKVTTILKGRCNAGISTADEKGWMMGMFHMWLVRNGIANILSIPQLERDGCILEYKTGGDWSLTTPQGISLVFKRDKGLCEGMPYISIKENQEALAMLQPSIQTVRKNYEGYTKKEIEKAILARKVQSRVGHPTDQTLKDTIFQECNQKQ